MTKNVRGGKGHRRGKAQTGVRIQYSDGPDQIYGLVTKVCGDRRFLVICNDGTTRMCHLRGKLRKRVNKDDYVLLTIRKSDTAEVPRAVVAPTDRMPKGDIIEAYALSEVRHLIRDKVFHPSLMPSDDGALDEQSAEFEFIDPDDDNSDGGQKIAPQDKNLGEQLDLRFNLSDDDEGEEEIDIDDI